VAAVFGAAPLGSAARAVCSRSSPCRAGTMAGMEITDTIHVPDEELQFSYARSGGPGGQNVNKVASKAVLHWSLVANVTLSPDVKARLIARHANRVTIEGELVLQSQRYRDQGRNVEDCRAKLREMILQALHPPKPRKASRPSRGSKERRLAAKRQQSQRKAQRRKAVED
jgi:ribosome-associated protein